MKYKQQRLVLSFTNHVISYIYIFFFFLIQSIYDFDSKIGSYSDNLYQLPKFEVLPLVFFRFKKVSSVFYLIVSSSHLMHQRRKWQPTPVFLPGESQGWGSLVGCRLWGCTESDMTEAIQQQQQQLSSEINGKLCLSERASISRCSFLLSLHTNEMNQNIQSLGIQLHGYEDSQPRSDDVKWNSFSPVARDMLVR